MRRYILFHPHHHRCCFCGGAKLFYSCRQNDFSAKQRVVCWIWFVAFAFDHHPNGCVHHSLNHFDQHCYYYLARFAVLWLVLVAPAAVGMGFETIQSPNDYRFLNIPVDTAHTHTHTQKKMNWEKLKIKIESHLQEMYVIVADTYLRAVN